MRNILPVEMVIARDSFIFGDVDRPAVEPEASVVSCNGSRVVISLLVCQQDEMTMPWCFWMQPKASALWAVPPALAPRSGKPSHSR